jgi:hypothetical protein
MHWLLLHRDSDLLGAAKHFVANTEEHRRHTAFSDSDHQIINNFVR